MAKTAATAADNALAVKPSGETAIGLWVYSGYPAIVAEYNRLIPYFVELYGQEAARLFQPFDLQKHWDPGASLPIYFLGYLQTAANGLNRMVAYIQPKLATSEIQIETLIETIRVNLRAAIFELPTKEKEIQNALDIILRSRGYIFLREKVTIQYSSKNYIPDFTIDSLDLAIEVKFCNAAGKEKTIIDEINADVVGYKEKYPNILFVVFDVGQIRDEALFSKDIKGNPGVKALVVKY